MSSMDRASTVHAGPFCDRAGGAPPEPSRFLTTAGERGRPGWATGLPCSVAPSSPASDGSASDARWAGVLEELPPCDPGALILASGRALGVLLSEDPTGLGAFRRAAATGRTPWAAVACGPEGALDAFGAVAHHLGTPALAYDLSEAAGSALLVGEGASPSLGDRLARWAAPPAPPPAAPSEPTLPRPEAPEALAAWLRQRAGAARIPDAETRLDRSLGGAAWFEVGGAEAPLLRETPGAPAPGRALGLVLEALEGPGDPFWSAVSAVASATRRLACTGAEALGLVVRLGDRGGDAALARAEQYCLGLRQASLSLQVPLAAVQVEPGGPEVLLAAVGSLEDCAGPVDLAAPDAKGLATGGARCAGRLARKAFEGLFQLGAPPAPEADGFPLDLELRLQACVREGVRLGLLRSAAQVGAGGLVGSALAVAGPLGVQLLLPAVELEALASEAPGRLLVTTGAEGEGALRTLCLTHGVPLMKVGVVGGGRATLALAGDPVADLEA